MKSSEIGRSMIEMLGVLAIIGVLSVGSMAGYSKMMGQYRVNTVLQQIQMIASKLSALGSSGNSYKNLNPYTAYRLGALPAEVMGEINGAETKIYNIYGDEILIEGASISEGTCEEETCDFQAYTLTYKGLSDAACTALGGNRWNSSNNSSFIGFGIGTTGNIDNIKSGLVPNCAGGVGDGYAYACSNTVTVTNTETVTIPLDLDIVTKACQCGTNGCSMVVKFF